MFKEISYEELLKIKNYVLIDVRTPKEFSLFTIPNSINIPIFTNEEHELIGTTYKKISIEEAKILGLDFVGKKLSKLYLDFKKAAEGKQLVFFCARGGLRSRVISQTMAGIGLPVIKLDYGYKGYRNFIVKKLPEIVKEIDFVTLFGKTGTGKTKILKELKKAGADILDLELAANHRGSLFGSIGLSKQNTQKQFEGLIFESLINRKSNIVFTEAESIRIGNIIMPSYLHDKIMNGKQINIISTIEYRLNNIKSEYLNKKIKKEEIKNAIEKLSKYISIEKVNNYLENLEIDNYDFLIEDLMINYYDNNYASKVKVFEYNYNNDTSKKTAEKLLNDFINN